MSGFWKGYANVNDDVRHTYERIFFGRETTANLDASEVPGMQEPTAPAVIGPETTHQASVSNSGVNPDTAAFYGRLWGNDDAPPHGISSPENGPNPTPGGAAVQIEPPMQGDDMTPGY